MSDKTLMLLAKDVRGKTLRILDGVTDQQSRYAPPGLQNHILWHAGHVLVVVEHTALLPGTDRQAGYPQEWFDKFSWQSHPATVQYWPKLSDVVAKLADQFERLTATIGALTEQQLAEPTGNKPNSRDLRGSILHGLHDEANHQGEMWLLKKMQNKRA